MDKETYEMDLEYSNKRKNTSADETELDNRPSRKKCTGESLTTPHGDSFAARHHDNHCLSDQRREQNSHHDDSKRRRSQVRLNSILT